MAKSLKILLVEDDSELCSSWLDLFTLIGHELTCFQRGLDALAASQTLEQADLLITDFYLPDINGVELTKRLREKRPELKAILLTGSRDAAVLEAARKVKDCTILFKPVNIEEIENQLKRVLAA